MYNALTAQVMHEQRRLAQARRDSAVGMPAETPTVSLLLLYKHHKILTSNRLMMDKLRQVLAEKSLQSAAAR